MIHFCGLSCRLQLLKIKLKCMSSFYKGISCTSLHPISIIKSWMIWKNRSLKCRLQIDLFEPTVGFQILYNLNVVLYLGYWVFLIKSVDNLLLRCSFHVRNDLLYSKHTCRDQILKEQLYDTIGIFVGKVMPYSMYQLG